jgi:hypothetical protein
VIDYIPQKNQIQLIYFELSKKITCNKSEQHCESPYYMSVEVITNEKFS